MRAKSVTFLVITLILVAAIAYVSLFGFNLFGKLSYDGILDPDGLNKGIDLAGGSILTFEADKADVTSEEMDTVEAVMRTRLAGEGYTEARVSRNQSVPGRIRVEIPQITDTESAKELLGSTAQLTFRDSAGNVVMDGSDVETATSKYGKVSEVGNSENYVELTLKQSGVEKFAAATAAAAAKSGTNENYIAMMLDENLVSAPSVKETINSETCIISGSFDQASAATLANQIKSGSLPVSLTAIESSTVGPELGETALSSSLWAALIGIILIMIFMLIFYRLPGLVADIALIGYIGIMCLIIGGFKINLSLSGIAGIILSIGMAVDANVIIFERLKEELKNGKTVRASVDAGFHRALGAIVDGNITTLIAAVVLWCSGVATVQGFAITLFIGVILSMLTAIFLTRFLLKQIVGLNVKNIWLYGVKKREE